MYIMIAKGNPFLPICVLLQQHYIFIMNIVMCTLIFMQIWIKFVSKQFLHNNNISRHRGNSYVVFLECAGSTQFLTFSNRN